MGKNSAIAWTDDTFNPWWGCVRVSQGCVHCYAETFSHRLGNDIWGVDKSRKFFGDKHWNEPVKWDKEAKESGQPRYVFCGSMCDWLEDRPDLVAPRARLIKLIEATPNLTWLLLTKRIENAVHLVPEWLNGAPKNAWFGVTTEDQISYDKRIGILLGLRVHFDASVVWLSIEPQISEVSIDVRLDGRNVDWAIVGGESGTGCRPFNIEWARSIKKQCDEDGVAFFLKQLGGHPSKRHNMTDFPEDLQVRDYPNIVKLPK